MPKIKKLKWDNLTPKQKALLGNGCGAKAGKLKPPQWLFRASCNHHDFNYWLGHTEADRKRADKQFYQAMKKDAVRSRSQWRLPARITAWIYYRAVRWFGKKAFSYGSTYKTWDDIPNI